MRVLHPARVAALATAAAALWSLAGCDLFDPPRYGMACQEDADCGEGYRCQAGVCVPDDFPQPEADAGPRADAHVSDVARVDLGEADAAAPDHAAADVAQADTARPDATQLDAVPADSGGIDASAADAQAVDSGPATDSGLPTDATGQEVVAADAGTRDSGAPDLTGPYVLIYEPAPSASETTGHFGAAVAARGNDVLVGMPNESSGVGAVYQYQKVGSAWQVVGAPLHAGITADNMGYSIAIGGDKLAMGAPGRNDGNGWVHVYYYDFGESEWRPWTTLLLTSDYDGRMFGASVAVSADGLRVIVGAPEDWESDSYANGAAYVFEISNPGSPLNEGRLLLDPEQEFSKFGDSVAIASDGSWALVGAPGATNGDGTTDGGLVRQCQRSEHIWTCGDPLANPDGTEASRFGSAIAVSGEVALVGAPVYDTGRGRVYVYQWNGSEFLQRGHLPLPDLGPGLGLGGRIAATDGTILVAASLSPVVGLDWSACVLSGAGTSWSLLQVVSGDVDGFDRAGVEAAAISDDDQYLVIGVPGRTFNGVTGAGQVLVYSK